MKLSKKQQLFIDLANEGHNIFLTGKAGTGKSHVVKKLINDLKENKKNVVALAPTGVAANNINGQTLHSFFSLQPFGVLDYKACHFVKTEKKRLFNKIDTIFIDEVSMLRPDLLDAINWTLIKNGCQSLMEIQIIFIGDLKQLPAPIDDNMMSVLLSKYEGQDFFNAQIYKDLEVQEIELDEVLRQNDEEFILNLNIIREGGKSEYFRKFANLNKKGIILAPHNATVVKYNLEGLHSVDGKEYIFNAIIEGNIKADSFNLESQIRVKDGCKIMYLANSSAHNNLINGTLGTFFTDSYKNHFIKVDGINYAIEAIELSKKEYVLSDDNKSLELKELGKITQLPIKLAYALTIHKSQGLTFDEITIDLTIPCFAKGQLYTALSRVKSPEGLTIITR